MTITDKMLERVGAVVGISGGLLVALNIHEYSRWGFVAFLVSSGVLGWLGIRKKMYSFFWMQMVFQVINSLGVYRWFFA